MVALTNPFSFGTYPKIDRRTFCEPRFRGLPDRRRRGKLDPDYALYADLADPAHPTGSECAGGTPGPGYCVDSTGFNVTVWIRTIATFTDGKPMTPWDVIFSYQALTWSTLQNGITQALWWQ